MDDLEAYLEEYIKTEELQETIFDFGRDFCYSDCWLSEACHVPKQDVCHLLPFWTSGFK